MPFDPSRFFRPLPGRPLAVAEIGTAHGGDLQKGLDLVDACADAGADVAKVQVVFAAEILPPEAGLVPLPGGPTPLYEVFRRLERPADFYAALAERADKRGIGFLASPFGEKSAALLEEIGVKAWKVASPELNHEPLLDRLASTGLPLILSTGVSRPDDIRRALEIAEAAWRASGRRRAGVSAADTAPPAPLTLLHCLTSYPAPEDQANLRAIPALAAGYGYPAGLSDHSLDPVLLPALSCALGAVMVEKHITLSRSGDGLDDPVALVPDDFTKMTSAMRRFAGFAGSTAASGTAGSAGATGAADTDAANGTNDRNGSVSGASPSTVAVRPDPPGLAAAVDELAAEYGRDRVIACLGSGVKELAAAEEANYGRTNRSLHAVGPLKAGTVIDVTNTALLRTEKVLRPGIEPRFRSEAYGRTLLRDVTSGDGITWDDLGDPADED